jgi:hypothetical protein
MQGKPAAASSTSYGIFGIDPSPLQVLTERPHYWKGDVLTHKTCCLYSSVPRFYRSLAGFS